jgi:protein-tyrosine phosphatase
MAEVVARHCLAQRSVATRCEVDSCGTASFNVGKAPDPRALAALRKRGYEHHDHTARQISDEDFAAFTHIVAMDRSNLRTLQGWLPADFRGNLRLLLDPSSLPGGAEIADPFYGNAGHFDEALCLIERGVASLLDEILGAD